MDDRIREPAPYEAPNPPKKMLDQATSHLQMLGAIDLDGFNQWVIHNPGGVCVLMQALLDRLPIPTREAMIQSIAAQSVAQGGIPNGWTIREEHGALLVGSPIGGPGSKWMALEDRGTLERRLLIALAQTLMTPTPAPAGGDAGDSDRG